MSETAAYAKQTRGSMRLWYFAMVLIVVMVLIATPFAINAVLGPSRIGTSGEAAELAVLFCAYIALGVLIFRRLKGVSRLVPAVRAIVAFGLAPAAYVALAVMIGPRESVFPSILLHIAGALLIGALPVRGRASETTAVASQQGFGKMESPPNFVSEKGVAFSGGSMPSGAPKEPVGTADTRGIKLHGSLIGTARNVRRGERQPSFFTQTFVSGGQNLKPTVLSFRLEQTNEVGDVTGYRQVELVGDIIRGDIVEGDTVEIPNWKDTNGIVVPEAAFNRSSSSLVSAMQQDGVRNFARVKLVAGTIFTIVFFIIFGIVATIIP